ncbi:MAG: MaoC/PaaZ C-terminal domain-containing protein [Actinomycetota bacterium]|nr:MaoC/PaaZ C-terminal domain-containing protein [Actinomycetota bacterium]
MSETANLTLNDVKEGADLPPLSYDVTPTTVVLGALATRDFRPMHHDKDFAQNRNGVQDIFLNTPNQAAWFERYLTDWTGPKGRLGKIQFRMKNSVFPGDTMVFKGMVEGVGTDDAGCGWVDVAVNLSVGDKTVTDCSARLAVPVDANDNPWQRKGDAWQP